MHFSRTCFCLLKRSKLELSTDIESLTASANQLPQKAESSRDMSILVKSNGMHRVSKEKITEMTELERQLADKLSAEKLQISCSTYKVMYSVNSWCQSLTLLLNATDIYCFTMDYIQVDDSNLLPALIITVLLNTVQYTSVSHCSLNFEVARLGYSFLSISVLLHYLILVLENCKFRSLKVLEKSLNFVL